MPAFHEIGQRGSRAARLALERWLTHAEPVWERLTPNRDLAAQRPTRAHADDVDLDRCRREISV
jgi:hypothetical protein